MPPAERPPLFLAGLIALFFVAINMRPHVVGVGPLLPAIRGEFGVSYGVVGGLVTIPLLCMGVFAILAVPVSRLLGTRRTLAGCLLLIAVFGYVRTVFDSPVTLLVLTVPVGIGVGIAGVLLPVSVKEDHPQHLGLATGVYATGMQLGSTASVALAAPLAGFLGGWQWPLALYSVVALVSAAVWLSGNASEAPVAGPVQTLVPHAWRRPDTWLLAWIFFLVSMPFFGLNAWLTAAYAELGWPLERAGMLTATVGLAGIPGTLLPGLITRTAKQRCGYLSGAALIMLLACVALILLPEGAWIWAAVAGLCQGGMFTVILTLPTDVSSSAREVGQVSSAMLTSGYVLGSIAPVLLGTVRDVFASFSATLWVIAAAVAVLNLTALFAKRRLAPTPLPSERVPPRSEP